MKKIFLISSACFSLAVGSLFAQSEIDALKYSKSDINGTARYMSMAGAFGALGADISTLANNPAGIGVYRSSEFAATANLSNVATSSMWNGTSVDASNLKFNFNNIAYIGTFKPDVEGLVNFNFGIGFNRLNDYYRNYSIFNSGLNGLSYDDKGNSTKKGISLTNYISSLTNRFNGGNGISESDFKNENAYHNIDSWISILGYDAGIIDTIGKNKYIPMNTAIAPSARLRVSERGYLDEYNISFGGNIYDVFYFGATVGITDLSYTISTTYDEVFDKLGGYTLNNIYETRGSGINLKTGIILRPTDFLRFGLAVHTPTFFKMTNYFDANILNNYADGSKNHPTGSSAHVYVPENAFTEYSQTTPFKLQASTAIILGKMGILSFEYEYVDYSNMKMKDTNGYGWSANDSIIKHLNAGNNLKVGAEIRITPQLSLRGGFATQSPIVKANVINQKVEVNTLGATLPHYTLDKGTTYYTGGFGYRFGSYYTDFAFVSRQLSEDVYAFSPIRDGSTWNAPEKATLKTTVNQVLFTFGVKF